MSVSPIEIDPAPSYILVGLAKTSCDKQINLKKEKYVYKLTHIYIYIYNPSKYLSPHSFVVWFLIGYILLTIASLESNYESYYLF